MRNCLSVSIILFLFVVLMMGTVVLADEAETSIIDNLAVDIMENYALRISWDDLNESTFEYILSICNNDTLMCKMLGTTIAHSFYIENLEPHISYSVHVGSKRGNTLSVAVKIPDGQTGTDQRNNLNASAVSMAEEQAVISDIHVTWLSVSSLIVAWEDTTIGSPRYTISLNNSRTSQPVLQGTTTARSFIIDSLESYTEYQIQIASSADNTVLFILPPFDNTQDDIPAEADPTN